MEPTSDDASDRRPLYVVLGANGGVGSALCRRLAEQGAVVLAGSRDSVRSAQLLDSIGAHVVEVDATDSKRVDHCFTEIVERFGRIDGVANCVGSLLLKPAHLTTDEDWAATISTNLTSSFFVLRAAARNMMKNNGGSIVLVSSAAASVGLANHEAIAAAKAGVAGLTLAAAASYATQKIRVNAVAPGLVRTPLTARLTSNATALKVSTAMHPLGRVGEPADIANAIAWLLSPEQSWISGQVLGVDGGLATLRPRASA